MKNDQKPVKPGTKEAMPVKQEDGKEACPLRIGDILKVLGGG